MQVNHGNAQRTFTSCPSRFEAHVGFKGNAKKAKVSTQARKKYIRRAKNLQRKREKVPSISSMKCKRQEHSEPLTRNNIRNLVGTEATGLWDYPRMVSLLASRPKRQIIQSKAEKIEREEGVVKLVEQAIEQLKAKGSRVSQRRISDLVGMPRSTLLTYPRVRALLEQLAESLPPLDLQKVVQADVEQAQVLGTSLSYRSISERIGVSIRSLRMEPLVRAVVERAQNERRQRHENDLINRVEHAIEDLVSQGERVSVHKVCQIVGMDHRTLDRCPQIRELFLLPR